jgi:hypothetical protein
MKLTWTVPVTWILAVTAYLTLGRYFRHKERIALAIAAADPATAASLGVRLDALDVDQRARQTTTHG